MMRRAIFFTSLLAVAFATDSGADSFGSCFRTQVRTWTSGHPSASLGMARWIPQSAVPRGISVSQVERLATGHERRVRRLPLFPPEGDIPAHL